MEESEKGREKEYWKKVKKERRKNRKTGKKERRNKL